MKVGACNGYLMRYLIKGHPEGYKSQTHRQSTGRPPPISADEVWAFVTLGLILVLDSSLRGARKSAALVGSCSRQR